MLEKLDTMEGRYIDNANFYHFKDIEQVSDEELYDHLLDEFPSWIKEAREKGVLK
ncbi:Uncharacterised protein [Mycobacteroides abscessus subsp. abscessus]|nr:Uncharacterised protein [Mycobacteroides abscessus subsp. abscessus]